MAEHPIQGLMNVTMEKIHQMVDSNTIIGKPITTEDGITILPVSKVSFGFASGGTDFDGKNAANKDLFGGGSGAGVNIQPATLEKICRLPQVVAVKEANPDVAQAMEKINLVGDDATFYCGNDDLTIPLMVLGFQGVISVLSNVMPAETSKMTSLALSGNWAEASKMQRDLLPMVKALFCETSPIPCKAAMSMMGMCRNELRLPLIPMQEANQQKLADIMRGWKLI